MENHKQEDNLKSNKYKINQIIEKSEELKNIKSDGNLSYGSENYDRVAPIQSVVSNNQIEE